MKRIVDLAHIDIIKHAERGYFEPLARHIENGGTLCERLRELLVAYMRGEIKNSKRSWGQISLEEEVVFRIRLIQAAEKLRVGKCSEYRAKQIFLDRYPEMNAETLKTNLRNHRSP